MGTTNSSGGGRRRQAFLGFRAPRSTPRLPRFDICRNIASHLTYISPCRICQEKIREGVLWRRYAGRLYGTGASRGQLPGRSVGRFGASAWNAAATMPPRSGSVRLRNATSGRTASAREPIPRPTRGDSLHTRLETYQTGTFYTPESPRRDFEGGNIGEKNNRDSRPAKGPFHNVLGGRER